MLLIFLTAHLPCRGGGQPIRVDESAENLEDIISYVKEVYMPRETKSRGRLVGHLSHATPKAGSCPTGTSTPVPQILRGR